MWGRPARPRVNGVGEAAVGAPRPPCGPLTAALHGLDPPPPCLLSSGCGIPAWRWPGSSRLPKHPLNTCEKIRFPHRAPHSDGQSLAHVFCAAQGSWRSFLALLSLGSPHGGVIARGHALCHRLVQPGLVWRRGATRTPNMLRAKNSKKIALGIIF